MTEARSSLRRRGADGNSIEAVRRSYDGLAEEYARRLFNELDHKPRDCELLDRFASEVGRPEPVCDMGCGPGHVARYLHDRGVPVFGLDLSPRMLAVARRLNSGIRFCQGDMHALPISDAALAGIAAFYAIVNTPRVSLPAVFREMGRVLRPGGLLLLAFHLGTEVIRQEALWGLPISVAFYHFTAREIVVQLRTAGLAVEQVVARGPYAPEVEYQSRRAYVFARRPRLARPRLGTVRPR